MGSLLHAPRLPVPVIPSQGRRAWPKHADARPVTYHTLTTALTSRYPYDAHLAGYSVPAWAYRLSSGALFPEATGQLPDGVAMVLAAFDVDCPLVHRASGRDGDVVASDDWWQTERRKVESLAHKHPTPFVYRSRGGYRLLWLLPEINFLRESTDREVWSTRYLTWCAYLARGFDIHADPSCKDWTRLYRLPHATREEGGQPEERETLGDPRRIGVWTCEPTAEDVALAQTLSRRKADADASPRHVSSWGATRQGTGEGILYDAFHARGWLGQEIEAGKFAIACPWERLHTKGVRFDTSTILFTPGSGEVMGWFYCSHSHCQTRDLRDVLALFTPSELARAREAAGLQTETGLTWKQARARRLRTQAEETARRILAKRGGRVAG